MKIIRVDTSDPSSVEQFFEDALSDMRGALDEARLLIDDPEGADKYEVTRALNVIEQHQNNLSVILTEAMAGMAAALENARRVEEELQDVLTENEMLRSDAEYAFESGFESGLEDAELGMRYQYADEMNVYDQRLAEMKAQVEHIRVAVQAAQEGDPDAMQWLIDWASAEPSDQEVDLDIFEGEADE